MPAPDRPRCERARARLSHAPLACAHTRVATHTQVAEFAFDDIELYELDVLSPPPPSPPPPPNYLLWLDGEGGPKGVQTVAASGIPKGKLTSDLSSHDAAQLQVTSSCQRLSAIRGRDVCDVCEHTALERTSCRSDSE